MVKYNKSIVYKLCCKDPNITDIYIGSTTNFTRRKCAHKNVCNNENSKSYNFNVYKFIRENGKWDNWDMIQVETVNAGNKRDLEMRERYHIETLKSSLNLQIPTQTKAEYYQNNKEHIAEYRQKNKESIAYTRAEYYQNNKEHIAEYGATYYQKNKESLAKKVTCECGSEINKYHLHRHKKSQKHIKSLESIVPPIILE